LLDYQDHLVRPGIAGRSSCREKSSRSHLIDDASRLVLHRFLNLVIEIDGGSPWNRWHDTSEFSQGELGWLQCNMAVILNHKRDFVGRANPEVLSDSGRNSDLAFTGDVGDKLSHDPSVSNESAHKQ
jgi:hypothetical protein